MKLVGIGFLAAALGSLTLAWAQNGGLTARQLYYGGSAAPAEETQPDPAAQVSTQAKGKGKAAPASQTKGKATTQAKAATPPRNNTPANSTGATTPANPANNGTTSTAANSNSGNANPSTNTGANSGNGQNSKSGNTTLVADSQPSRLGMRYSLLKVDIQTGRTSEVDPDQNFAPGDCFAVRLRPNRTGRVYVFNKSSSGGWQALLPSAEMPEETNRITSGTEITVPRGYCFGLDDPAGVDTLLVAMTDRQEDINQLEMQQAGNQQATPARPVQAEQNVQEAPANGGQFLIAAGPGSDQVLRVTNVINQGQGLISRDVVIQKIANVAYQDEPSNAVYVVKTADTSEDRLVIEIPIRHENQ